MPRWLGVVLFFTTALVVYGGLHFYLYFRLANGLDLGPHGRLALKVALPLLAVSYLCGRLLDRIGGSDLGMVLAVPGVVWMGLFALLAMFLLAFDLCFSLPVLVLEKLGVASGLPALKAVARWAVIAALGLSVVCAGYGLWRVLRGPEVVDVEVRLPGLPPDLDGFRLVQVSDIHAGGLMTRGAVEDIVDRVSGLDADLVAITGDLTDEEDGGDGTVMALLASMRSRNGVFAVTGNHEAYVGRETVIKAIEDSGIRVLRQSHRVVASGIVLAGIDDPTFLDGQGKVTQAIDAALKDRPRYLPAILLSHQPTRPGHAAARGVSLMLCGHTHGGQIPPFHLVTGLSYHWWLSGAYEVDSMTLYVNPGTGFWGPPMRIFADAEITRFILRTDGGHQP